MFKIMAAGLIAFIAAVITVLLTGYQYGALNLSVWFFGVGAATAPYAFIDYHLSNCR